jgi:N-acetylmuramoyl-L-alanine amidase
MAGWTPNDRPDARPVAGGTSRPPRSHDRRRAGYSSHAPTIIRQLALALFWLALALAPALVLAPGGALAQARGAPDVVGVRFGVNGEVTRVVLDIDGPTRFATRVLTSPPRLVVELENVRWRVRDHPQGRPVGLVRGVNYGHLENGRGRLVVETDRPFRILREERLPPSGDARQHRILVDLVALPPPAALPPVAAAPPAAPPTTSAPAHTGPTAGPTTDRAQRQAQAAAPPAAVASRTASRPEPPRTGPPRPRPGRVTAAAVAANGGPEPPPRLPLPGVTEPAPLPPGSPGGGGASEGDSQPVEVAMGPVLQAPPAPQRRHIIALDPGHGGADPGTIGINGVLEKDVTLDLARRLKALIEATGRYEVVMTRSDDVFVSLRDRMERGRRSDASLFISIHADSIGDARFRGASVYTLSDQASDAEAARLATKENRADVIAGTDLSAHDEIVAGILIDLAQRVTNNKSIEFADVLTAELGDVTALVRNTRRFAGFVVLKSPDVPSVLLELGYLSNPTDAANLARPEYRDRLARATLRAIDRYFGQADAAL